MLQLEKAMNDSLTFLIVRHPFERLLSAYRDKIMFAIPHSLHDKLGHRIIKKYRKSVRFSIYLSKKMFEIICYYCCRDEFENQNGHYSLNL